MAAATTPQAMESFTINIPKVDIKRFKGLVKAMGWTFRKVEYYESPEFYADIEKAEQDIANGEGKQVNNIDELNALFS